MLNKKVTWFASKKVSNQPFAMDLSSIPVALLQVSMAARMGGQLGWTGVLLSTGSELELWLIAVATDLHSRSRELILL